MVTLEIAANASRYGPSLTYAFLIVDVYLVAIDVLGRAAT
jgi:hypothetical protein